VSGPAPRAGDEPGEGLGGRPVAVLGFGNQGEAQALNLRDAGAEVRVGARPGGQAEGRALRAGFPTSPLAEAARGAAVVAVLLPDEAVPQLWPDLAPAWVAGVTMVFAHGFNLLYSDLEFPPDADVVLVSPTGPGRILRERYVEGGGLPAYLAVHHDRSGRAWTRAEAYALAIGATRELLWRTTVAEETEVDLFGEQVVLCGGMNALVTAAFETLAGRGYAPEMAYLECVHQLKYLADLLHERGITGLRQAISGTARYGDLTRGPRVVGEASRAEMARILEEIRSGEFAAAWRAEVAAGKPRLGEMERRAAAHPIEEARRRAVPVAAAGARSAGESRKALSKN
jgi:ketol-acid reductoisomerase